VGTLVYDLLLSEAWK